MIVLQTSEGANWALFVKITGILQAEFGGILRQKLDRLDQLYWDLVRGEQTLTLHLEHHLGASMMIPEGSQLCLHRVRSLLEQSRRLPHPTREKIFETTR